VQCDGNADGLFAVGAVGGVQMSVVGSVFSNHSGIGIGVSSAPGAPASILIDDSRIASNATGIQASNATTIIRLSRSTVTANNVGWAAVSSGQVLSYVTNNIDNNTSGNAAPPTIALK